MDSESREYPVTPPPADEYADTHAEGHAVRRRHRLAVPAVVAALAVGATGAGLGYAAASYRSGTTSAAAGTTTQGSASSQQLPPGYSWQRGDQYSQGDQTFGGPSYGNQQFSSPDTSGSGTGSSSSSTDTTGRASGSQLAGLVRIVSTLKYAGGEAAGTGLVLTSNGEVVTNHHVVAGATKVRVTVMSTGKTYTAQVVGTDATADVAVLQLVGASGLSTVTPDADAVKTGQSVTAVGDGNGTVSYLSKATGTILATGRSITTQSDGVAAGERLRNLIEISSDVVGGYSGGATYDAQGEVLGMTTAASSGTNDIVGYAIPIATVTRIAGALESGATGTAYTYGYPAFLGIGLGSGTTVQRVYAGTPAAKAGITAGDKITKVGSTRTTTTARLRAAIAAHQPGDRISITWRTAGGTRHTATITLIQGPVA